MSHDVDRLIELIEELEEKLDEKQEVDRRGESLDSEHDDFWKPAGKTFFRKLCYLNFHSRQVVSVLLFRNWIT